MTSRMPFIRPSMPPVELLQADLAGIVESNWYTNFGPVEQGLRADVADFVGGDVAVTTVNNATTGLMAALAAVLPRGDGTAHVATPSFTFAAAAQTVVWHGYLPLFFDIDAGTLQPSLDSFGRLDAAAPDVRAIVLTNTFGIANEQIGAWERVALERGIPLVIDSAPGFGSEYVSGERLGARGDAEIFSFHATKALAVGEAGVVTSRDPELTGRMRQFTNFGFDGSGGAAQLGMNGKLQEMTAAIARRQLARFAEALAERRSVFQVYLDGLSALPVWFPEGADRSALCFAPMVAESPEARDRVLHVLHSIGIEARTYYAPPVHRHLAMTEYAASFDLPITDDVSSRMISLPVLSGMTRVEVARVVAAVRAAF